MKRLCVLLALTGCELLIGDETGGSGFGFGSFPPPPPPPSSTGTNFGPVLQTAPVPRPISGGTMFVSRDGRTAIVADPDRGVVWLVDLVNKTRRDTIELYQGDEP